MYPAVIVILRSVGFNADDTDHLGADVSELSYNLFVYCMNDPVNRFDVDGNWSLPRWAEVAVGAVATAGLAVTAVCTDGAVPSGGWQGSLDGTLVH